jgi:ApbE superfamily uncharacterized protein (UPF0280 family)
MGPTAHLLQGGTRLHLQHGPIDLIIGADGQRKLAFEAAMVRFETILDELVAELPQLRMAIKQQAGSFAGAVAQRMSEAARSLGAHTFVTPMAAVAGAVADEVLVAMCAAAKLDRAYVNNGGDIALHLANGFRFTTAMVDHAGRDCGQIIIHGQDGIGGIATSGRHGRSFSLGIADSVTVLAPNAARADVAATLIANAVDLPGHPLVTRSAACELDETSDLEDRSVVTGCGVLSDQDCQKALQSGMARTAQYCQGNLIHAAALFLQGHSSTTNGPQFAPKTKKVAYV